MFLVVGANGQLGNELRLLLKQDAEYVDRDELDITDKNAVLSFVSPANAKAPIVFTFAPIVTVVSFTFF